MFVSESARLESFRPDLTAWVKTPPSGCVVSGKKSKIKISKVCDEAESLRRVVQLIGSRGGSLDAVFGRIDGGSLNIITSSNISASDNLRNVSSLRKDFSGSDKKFHDIVSALLIIDPVETTAKEQWKPELTKSNQSQFIAALVARGSRGMTGLK